MNNNIINFGCCFLRRVFKCERKISINIFADRQSYIRKYCMPMRGDGNDGNWLLAGSFVKFRIWIDGNLIGIGPFRAIDDKRTVKHEFKLELAPGNHIIAIAYRGNGEGLGVQIKGAEFISSWKYFDANNIYMPINLRKPAVDGYFKGDVGAGEYREHIDGTLFPDDWYKMNFDDSKWSLPEFGKNRNKIEESLYELVHEKVKPQSIHRTGDGRIIIDFGREIIGSPQLRGPIAGGEVEFKLAEEMFDENRIRSEFREYMLCYQEIWTFKPGHQWLGNFGLREFRYAEIINYNDELTKEDVYVDCFRAPFSEDDSKLETNDINLNAVWKLCKNTIKTTSMDIFTDCFHRERIAYEADAFINMLAQFAVNDDTRISKRTIEYLAYHPTWPLEWRLLLPHLYLAYYWESGNIQPLEKYFDRLKDYCGLRQLRKNGLVRIFPDNKVLIDWPITYQDKYDFGNSEYLLVPNALSGKTLEVLSKIASIIGKENESRLLLKESQTVYQAINNSFFDNHRGLYIDHPDSKNSSMYANMWMLWCGGVPEERVDTVIDYVDNCGMNCSLYSAFYYLETLFRYGKSQNAYSYLVRDGQDSWIDMIKNGLTLTSEYWYEPERRMSLAHPWGTSPLYLIVRYVFGIYATEPGWKKYIIEPKPTPLRGSGARLVLKKKNKLIESIL